MFLPEEGSSNLFFQNKGHQNFFPLKIYYLFPGECLSNFFSGEGPLDFFSRFPPPTQIIIGHPLSQIQTQGFLTVRS